MPTPTALTPDAAHPAAVRARELTLVLGRERDALRRQNAEQMRRSRERLRLTQDLLVELARRG